MADQPATPPAPGAPPAPAPAAAPAPATPPVAPAAPAAAAPAAPAPKKPQQGGGKGGKPKFDEQRFDQNPAAMKRIRKLAMQQATALIQEKFPNMSLDDAAELVRKASAAIDAGGGGGTPAGGAPAPGSDREKETLRRRVAKLTERVAKSKRKLVNARARGRDEVVELELRLAAVRAGITDETAIDFAILQYKKAAAAGAATGDNNNIPDEGPYFAGLRTSHPQIFGGAAAPPTVVLRPTSSPPPSAQPGGELPPAIPPGTKPKAVDAFEMSDDEFRRHKAGYGLR